MKKAHSHFSNKFFVFALFAFTFPGTGAQENPHANLYDEILLLLSRGENKQALELWQGSSESRTMPHITAELELRNQTFNTLYSANDAALSSQKYSLAASLAACAQRELNPPQCSESAAKLYKKLLSVQEEENQESDEEAAPIQPELYLALFLSENNQTETAILELSRFIRMNPDSPNISQAYTMLASLYRKEGKMQNFDLARLAEKKAEMLTK